MLWAINDDYRVRTEPMNYILEQRVTVTPKEGEPRTEWKLLGYYSGLAAALKALPNFIGLRADVDTVQKLMAELTAIGAELQAKLRVSTATQPNAKAEVIQIDRVPFHYEEDEA